jgi:hypothetical protein
VKYGDFMGFLDEQSESFHVASLFFLEQTRFFFSEVVVDGQLFNFTMNNG